MTLSIKPIERRTFNAATLIAEHPPRLRNRNKQVVFRIACPPGCKVGGVVSYSRWMAMPLPAQVDFAAELALLAREDVYDYQPVATTVPALEWHVNFADARLFVAYGSGLFAQDEMQVAEHPVLASIKEALEAEGQIPMTVAGGRPTPVLVRAAERRVAVATDPDLDAGRLYGLYGNRFAAASIETIERATRRIDPPTITNLICIAAPSGGRGAYDREDVEYVLTTAYTAFAAARIETREAAGDGASTIVHTGFWGCGAFGGNRILMALLQLIAARMASIDLVVFHAFSREGIRALADAQELWRREFAGKKLPTEEVLNRIVAMSFKWGEGDGN